ncbi:formate--tetrahydrofolate ligase [Brachybacterium hainanense]|uniref:Formate--tetrahydrofolate ligase n=1 Tax=Brachybacterium hainanense TaxID=1541174 RepID=A0ABV6RDN6_9MICO
MTLENPDLAISQAAELLPITEVARRAGIPEQALIPYGRDKAKVEVSAVPQRAEPGRLVLVSAMSPTPAGEGKSTVTVGLADAFTLLGTRAMVALREPSLGPVMGMKGGAAGGGHAQVAPMEDINLHFTGDFHAIQLANNTIAALLDNHIQHGNALDIDPRRVQWKRVLDVNDRALRQIVIGLGGPSQGTPREDGFDIVVASEIMAILCLSTSLTDLRRRVGDIVVAMTRSREPVTVRELGIDGAITLLLRDAMKPNLVQTLGGTPALVHGGPFANIAHGCSSLVATRLATSLADVTVTEAGFGSDLGAEKFLDIKARVGGLRPDAVVLVATVRALKRHGGAALDRLEDEDVEALQTGTANLRRHVENIRRFGLEPVVAVNRFPADTPAELEAVLAWAARQGVRAAVADVWARGGEGGTDVARELLAVMDGRGGEDFHHLYDPQDGIEASLTRIAQDVYGARGIQLTDAAPAALRRLQRNGWDRLPVCVAKTQYSFSDDASALGAPQDHVLHVRDLVPRIGAGFVVALTGSIMTMPGLPKQPAALRMDVDEQGRAVGLF